MIIRASTIKAASAYVDRLHRHHKAPRGALWAIAAEHDGGVVGVAIVGRPVAKGLQDWLTGEVTRLCTDGTPNACSFLYGAAWRAARALGYTRLVTYILASEPGTSLRAAGWTCDGIVKGRPRGWDTATRRRTAKKPADVVDKIRWSRAA